MADLVIPPEVEKTRGVNEPSSTSLILCSYFLCFSSSCLRYTEANWSSRYDRALGSTLLRKPTVTVSLHRQRTSRRQRVSHLHRLVNGDVYGSRILIVTPTSLSHVRAIY